MSLTQEEFLADVANHRMAVELDRGLYRRLIFFFNSGKSPHSQWFEIITWPGALVMSGEIGSWVFRREQDMFEFFRGKQISPDYWHEKLEAVDRHGAQEFDADVFRADALARLDNWGLDESELAVARAELSEHLTHYEDEWELRQALADWGYGGEVFDPCDMPSGMVYTRRFLWACHAIRWAVEQYDALGAKP